MTVSCISFSLKTLSILTLNKMAFGRIAYNRKALSKIIFSKLVNSRQAFSRKAYSREAYSRKAYSRKAYSRQALGRMAFSVQSNIRLGWKWQTVTYPLAYQFVVFITQPKHFILQDVILSRLFLGWGSYHESNLHILYQINVDKASSTKIIVRSFVNTNPRWGGGEGGDH